MSSNRQIDVCYLVFDTKRAYQKSKPKHGPLIIVCKKVEHRLKPTESGSTLKKISLILPIYDRQPNPI